MKPWMTAGAALLATVLPVCAHAADRGTLVAVLHDAKGKVVGAATLTEVDGGMAVKVIADGMPGGDHGVQVHRVGKCDAPGDAFKVGANLQVRAKGGGNTSFLLPDATVVSVLDDDGATVVVSDGAARIACGVVQTS